MLLRFKGRRVAVLATDGFEESELTQPLLALETEGAKVEVVSPTEETILGVKHLDKGVRVNVDRHLDEARADDYDVLVLPGGAMNADSLRCLPLAQEFVRAFQNAGKPIAAICHAPWLLVSAGLVRGRTLTSYHSIQDDIRNAGGNWVDREVVVDDNWITSRQPADLAAFIPALFEALEHAPAAVH
jgi:protease I